MKPKFIAIAAATMDGRIAPIKRGGSSWTSPEDKDFLHRELDKCDLIIVGNTTYKHARKPLAKRKCLVFTHGVKGLKYVNSNLTFCNTKNLPALSGRICILGGSQVYSWFLKRKLIDEIYLTIEPIVFGAGVPLFDIPLKTPQTYKLTSIKKLNKIGTVVLKYTKTK